jgi:hypothetical protein
MKNYSTQQEVLLMTGTSFSVRQCQERESLDSSKFLTENEKLIQACWNGLLKDMLPEIFLFNDSPEKLYLWQVREANQHFMLEMGDHPTWVNEYLSIDPYRFMEVQEYS